MKRLVGPLGLLLLWYTLAVAIGRPVVPYPHMVFPALGELLWKGGQPGRLLLDALASLGRVLLGLILALAAGLPLGILIGRSRRAEGLLKPLVYLLFPIPKIAFLPVFIVLLGIGEASKTALLFSVILFHLAVSAADAARGIAAEYFQSLRVLGLGRFALYRHVVVPAVLPTVFSTLKISAGTALSVLFFAENYGTRRGLGKAVMDAWIMADYRAMYAGILVLGAIGWGLFTLIDAAERRACPWNH
jgi:NitT/TauT family transport system permease protein